MLRNFPLSKKLTIVILGTAIAVMLMMRVTFFAWELYTFRQAMVRQVTTIGSILAANSTAALAFENDADARSILAALEAERHVTSAALYDRDGRFFAPFPASFGAERFPAAPEADGYLFAPSRLISFQPVELNGRRLGTLYLEFNTGEVLSDFLWGSLWIALGVMAVVFVIAFGIARVLQQQISGPLVRLTETARDISEGRNYSVRALKMSNDEVGLLTDAFNQMLSQIDAQNAAINEHAIVAITNPQGAITFVNDKFCAISKYSREELLGQDHRIINSGYHPKEFFRDLWQTIARGQTWNGEIRNRAKDGSLYWVDTTIVPFLTDDGKPYQYVAIRADITQRKNAEENFITLNQQLENRVTQRTSQLEAANKELEAFSYSVSHDLRAPLRHIDGFAGMLDRSDGNTLSPRGRSHLHQIKDSAKQMGMLVDDLLVFARMGRAEMRLGAVDLQQLAEEAIEGLKPETQQRQIHWNKGSLPVVRGDRPMLRQVLVNLFANAVKYTRPRDVAQIAFGSQIDPGSGHYLIFVRDNGVGFEMKYAAKLFGVFQRLHRAEDFEGTGIGLANVQRIINRHGGKVWAEAEPDVGATFYFTLPKSNDPA